MNIPVDVLRKSVRLLLNPFVRSLGKLNIINNNFYLMLIHVQLVGEDFYLNRKHSLDLFLFFVEIENDFKIRIQEHVAKLDAEKAVLLAQLEKELNIRQELILESARKRIDDLNEEANRLKMVENPLQIFSLIVHHCHFRVFFVKLKLKVMQKSVSILS